MQKLSKRNTYKPTDSSLVCSSLTVSLNRDESLSEHGLKTFDNSLEGNQRPRTGGTKCIVYVQNKDGRPMMPCTPAKARHLLGAGNARVIQRNPFTIILSWQCEYNVQDITLGIDTGSKFIGFSAITTNKEVLSGTVILDTMQKKRLDKRRNYRKTRRSKKWYRKPRFLNRTKPKGWLPPSIERRYQAHLKIIEKIKHLLPITKTIIEIAQFDIQKLKNPETKGKEYQQGDLYEYSNKKLYIFAREKYTCQLCNKSTVGKKTNLHHIIPRGKGGTNKPNNLALLHKDCHKRLHKQNLHKKLNRPKQYREHTFMSIIAKRFKESPECRVTYGYKTHTDRNKQGLPKTHYNDAFIIAGGRIQERSSTQSVKQTKRNNRSIQKNRKGFAPAIRIQKFPIQPNDLVEYGGRTYRAKGTHCKGTRVVLEMYPKNRSININCLHQITYGKGLQFVA